MNNYLQQKPHFTGMISAAMSSVFFYVQHLLTDDKILKMVAGLGTWAGTFVAILAALAAGKKYLSTK